jgi:hypothetical protein
MFPELQCVGAWGEIGGSEFQQLLSAVNNRVLDFVLKIEAENPNAGEAPLNTHPVPEEKLQPLVQNYFWSNRQHGAEQPWVYPDRIHRDQLDGPEDARR